MTDNTLELKKLGDELYAAIVEYRDPKTFAIQAQHRLTRAMAAWDTYRNKRVAE